VPASVQTGWPRLLTGVTHLFRTLPTAVKQREEAVRINNDPEGVGDYDDDDDEDEDVGNDWTGFEDTDWDNAASNKIADDDGDVKDESQAYLDFLKSEVHTTATSFLSASRITNLSSSQADKIGSLQDSDDDDSVMDEDSMLETPLDSVEPYVMFRDSLLSKSCAR
jgi:importin-7